MPQRAAIAAIRAKMAVPVARLVARWSRGRSLEGEGQSGPENRSTALAAPDAARRNELGMKRYGRRAGSIKRTPRPMVAVAMSGMVNRWSRSAGSLSFCSIRQEEKRIERPLPVLAAAVPY
jgi:hypothetical protein